MKLAVLAFVSVVAASRLGADDDAAEMALKRFFEGRPVTVRVDMPATTSGIDLYPEREYPLEFSKVADRIRSSGVAVREGDRITVTRVKVKDDLIEFQLGAAASTPSRTAPGRGPPPPPPMPRPRRTSGGCPSRRPGAP